MRDIAPATDAEVIDFARRRTADAATARLYVERAMASNPIVMRDDGIAIGIAFAHDDETTRFLSEIYVEPSYRRDGIGGALYRALMADDVDRDRCGVFDASDLNAAAFTARIGLSMRSPVYRASGSLPDAESLAWLAAGEYRFATEAIDLRRHAYALHALDRESLGTSRPAIHAYLQNRATGFAFFLNEECVGYVYVSSDGVIGPMACASRAYALQMLAFAMITLESMFRASWATMLVPATNIRMLRQLIRFKFTLTGPWAYCADAAPPELGRYTGYSPLAF